MGKYDEWTRGQTEAVLNKLGGLERAQRFLRGELVVTEIKRRWEERDGVIYFSLTSDGTTGPEWEKWYDANGYKLSSEARFLLSSPDFKPTKKGTVHRVGVIKGETFTDADRITKKIRLNAVKRKLILPEVELACLIRRAFSNEEVRAMGFLWIITMHDPITDSGGDPDLLGSGGAGAGAWLRAYCDDPDDGWDRGAGFAFGVPQKS